MEIKNKSLGQTNIRSMSNRVSENLAGIFMVDLSEWFNLVWEKGELHFHDSEVTNTFS